MKEEEYDYEWHLGGFSSNNEKMLEECAVFFSAHYGKWSKKSSHRPGKSICLSKNKISEWLKNPNSAVYMARNKGELIGYAIAIRLNIPRCGKVSWVTQLVVHTNYRNQEVAKNILHSIWGFSDDFAWGLVSSSPYAIRALEKATRRRCDPSIIKKHVNELLDVGSDQISYIHRDKKKLLVDCNDSKINTEFLVDHSNIDSMLKNVTSDGVDWKLGQLEEGWEWFAFTFREQQPISLTKTEIEKMLQASDKIVQQAYGRMIMSNRQSWATHTDSEVEFIIKECNLQPNDTVIDFGCGNGRHAVGLAKAGMCVKAVDYSSQRIKEAKEQLSKTNILKNSSIEFIVGDCRTINLGQAKAVICLYDVIGSYVNDADNREIITNIFQHLISGGTALMSVMNYCSTKAQAKRWFTVSKNPDELLNLPPSGTMEKTGNVFDPDYYMIDKETQIVYRKERFQSNQNQLPTELIVRDKRFTKDEIKQMCYGCGLDVLFTKYVNATNWQENLLSTYAKEILIKCQKKSKNV
ncbi:MAG: methyltransferase domain-containing protein [Planctomycetaceae bacterium]|jgi:2-polyprenyl-3-methyl-5-hydroxy-6-metoxy-1,4-benzoquinol methylase|nr:methyltransferase domain-containing protein [Planctomycetaceae bacterium]